MDISPAQVTQFRLEIHAEKFQSFDSLRGTIQISRNVG